MAAPGGIDLELLREILGKKDPVLTLATVLEVEVNIISNKVRALCQCYPNDNEVIAEQTFGATGASAGWIQVVQVGELVLLGMIDKDNVFILGRLSGKNRQLPLVAKDGHLVGQALAGKKAYLSSDTKVLIGKGGILDPSEPLVLGNVMKEALGYIFDEIAAFMDKIITGPVGLGNLGNPVPTDPALVIALTAQKTAFLLKKEQYVNTAVTNIVSQIAFTER